MNSQGSFVGISNKLKLATKIFFILVSLLYFAFHALNGENGLRSYSLIKEQLIERQKLLDSLKRREQKLEINTKLLKNNSLDLDLLEERCRAILNYAFDNDIIIDDSSVYIKN